MARRKAESAEESRADVVAGEEISEAAGEPEMAPAGLNGDDPAMRLADVARRYLEAETAFNVLKTERDSLVVELNRRGWTEAKLAWMLRVSQVRVHQILKEQKLVTR